MMQDQDQMANDYYNQIKTPIMGNTPYNQYAGGESSYSVYGTPGYGANFSPGPN